MILYKYMSLDAANSILTNQSIGFSQPEYFNDPFEMYALNQILQSEVGSDLAASACHSRLNKHYAVLSLTRNPLNALMWAHYGEHHTGVVLGINMKVAGFNQPECNLIPASYGDMIYTQSKPTNRSLLIDDKKLMSIGDDYQFVAETMSLYQSAFLYKSAEWFLEEEVRVVKNITSPHSQHLNVAYSNLSGNWHQIQTNERPLFCYQLPDNAIKEIHFGLRSYRMERISNVSALAAELGLEIYQVKQPLDSWNLHAVNRPQGVILS